MVITLRVENWVVRPQSQATCGHVFLTCYTSCRGNMRKAVHVARTLCIQKVRVPILVLHPLYYSSFSVKVGGQKLRAVKSGALPWRTNLLQPLDLRHLGTCQENSTPVDDALHRHDTSAARMSQAAYTSAGGQQ